jgi:nucleoid DNA-binding protein
MRLVRFTPDPAFLGSLEAQAAVLVEGFGWFEVKHYGAYEGRNPKTGAVIRVEAKR